MEGRGGVGFLLLLGREGSDLLQPFLPGDPARHDHASVLGCGADVLPRGMDANVHDRGADFDGVRLAGPLAPERKRSDGSLRVPGCDQAFFDVDAGSHRPEGEGVLNYLLDLVVHDDLLVLAGRHGEVTVAVRRDAGNPAVGGFVPGLGFQKLALSEGLRRGSLGGRRLERRFAKLVQLRPDIRHGPQVLVRQVVLENLGGGFEYPPSFGGGLFVFDGRRCFRCCFRCLCCRR
mmetsp:Transcript_26603/g.62497  ORF Transcript_26603/g.62497 Transcript_26603/m.62497 type:complete len:233 (-) Transcript_26603:713-1411(-)